MSLKDPYTHAPTPAPLPPPAYAQSPPVLCIASALYAYTPTDAGDLALQPNDRIQVLEHMNNDCMYRIIDEVQKLISSRVARTERTHTTRRHISSVLHQRRRRKRPARSLAVSPLRLRQHALSHNTTDIRLIIRPQPKALTTRRARQEIWQEDGQCRYLRCRCHNWQQHRERNILNGLMTFSICYKKLDAVRLRLLLPQISFGYGCDAENGVIWDQRPLS